MVGHLFQNYDTIYVRFFPTYTCNHSWYTTYVRFLATYTCVPSCFVGFLFLSIWPFSYKRAYICAQKKPIYIRYKQACAYRVTESRRIRGTELYCQQKSPSCRMEQKSNVSLNLEQGLFLIHCPHSSGGCWLPNNGFVGIRGLSLERLCTLFHECWPKQRSIQLEMGVWQAEHDSYARVIMWNMTSVRVCLNRSGGWVLNKFLYGGGPPLNLLYTIFHDFVYLLLTNGTPFKYLAQNFASLLTAGNQHCHKIGISHKYRSLPV